MNSEKQYIINKEQIIKLIDSKEGCLATDMITVDGMGVNYMYREYPSKDFSDSGWRFFANKETKEYLDDAGNSGVYMLNTIANHSPDIIVFLNAPYNSSFMRDEKTGEWEDAGRYDNAESFTHAQEKHMVSCYEKMNKKQEDLIDKYNLSSFESFLFDQQSSIMTFTDKGAEIKFNGILLGTFAHKKYNWLWSWANSSLLESVRQGSKKFMALTDTIGIDEFQVHQFLCSEKFVFEMLAMCIDEMDAMGFYKIPGDKSNVYLILTSIVK